MKARNSPPAPKAGESLKPGCVSFRQRLVLAILLIIIVMPADLRSQSKAPPATPLKLGIVKDDSSFDGCGCSLYLNRRDEKTHRAVFLADFAENAAINVNGKDLRLRLTASSSEKNDHAKVGDRSWEIYRAGATTLRVDYTVTKICDPNDESCEVLYYRTTLTLIHQGQRTSIKTTGLCGC